MKYIKLILLGAILALSGCSITYYTYSGSPVYTGQGGASKNVNGVDFWVMGTPPRKFRIIGYIEDSRKRGINGSITSGVSVGGLVRRLFLWLTTTFWLSRATPSGVG